MDRVDLIDSVDDDGLSAAVVTPAAKQERDLQWEKFEYTCSYLTPLELYRLRMVGYLIMIARVMRYLIVVNVIAYLLLLMFIFEQITSRHITVQSVQLILVAGLGVGFLTGATFIVWAAKDILPRSKK